MYEPTPVYLETEALKIYKEFYRQHNIEAATMTGDMAAEMAKLEEIPHRLALIFHCVEGATTGDMSGKVKPETMQNAIRLTEWFKNESSRVYRLFESDGGGESKERRERKRLLSFIQENDGIVSVRDAQRKMRYETAEETERVFGDLVKNGVAEWVNIPHKSKGKPSRGIKLRQCDSVTVTAKPSVLRGDSHDSTSNGEPEPTPGISSTTKQTEATAPDDLGDFMDFIDE